MAVAKTIKEHWTSPILAICETIAFLIIMAGTSYIADRLDKGWMHSLAIIFNIAGMVWFVQTVIDRTILIRLRIMQIKNKNKRLFAFIMALMLFSPVLIGIGTSVHFVKGLKTENPISIFLQNPFEAARKYFSGAGKNDATDMRADIIPPSQEVNNTAGETADKGAKDD
jgi:hypothetical protein